MRKGLLLCALLSALVGCENLGDTLTDDLTTTFTFYDENENELTACPYRIGTVLPADSLPKKSLRRGYLVGYWQFYQKETASGTSYERPPNVTVKDEPNEEYDYEKSVVTSVTVTSVPLSFQVAWWKPIRYTIIFDGNGGKTSAGKESYEQWFKYDEYKDKDERLDANKFERAGYTFKGWNTAEHKTATKADYEDKYELKDNFAEEDDAVVTLYACWQPNKITIVFDKNGGTGTMESQDLSFDDLPTQLTKNTFIRPGWNFGGWKAAEATFDDEQDITSSDYETLCAGGANGSVTLTAVWNPRCVVSSPQGFKDTDMTAAAEGFTFTAPERAAYQWFITPGDTSPVSTERDYKISYADYGGDTAEYMLYVIVFDASGVPTQTCWAKFHVESQR